MARALSEKRALLDLDTIAGITIQEFQTRVESNTAARLESWSTLKTFWRE